MIGNYALTVFCSSLFWVGVYFFKEIKWIDKCNNLQSKLIDSRVKFERLLFQYDMLYAATKSYTSTSTYKYETTTPLDQAYSYFGLSRSASMQEVKNKFRMLVKKHHPDRDKSQNAAVRFKAINDAYKLITSSR